MISNELIQKWLISKQKTDVDILSICNAVEVREQQWAGRTFVYPSTRAAVGIQLPLIRNSPCTWSRVEFSIFCFSEERSSKQADQLAGFVNALFHNAHFDATGDGFRFHYVRSNGLNSAIRMSERVWRAQAFFVADLHTI
jgi:hypothetical protein